MSFLDGVFWYDHDPEEEEAAKEYRDRADAAMGNVLRDNEIAGLRKRVEALEQENAELRHDLKRSMANHAADLNR